MDNSRHLWTTSLLLLFVVAQPVAADNTGLEVEARRLLDAGKAAEAVSMIQAGSPATERAANVWFLLADGYHNLMDDAGLLKKRGLAKKMKRSLEAALELEPDHVDARRELADFHFYAPWIVGGSKDEAAKQLELLERIAPAEAYSTRGDHARNVGDLEKARDHFRKSLDLGPRKPGRLFALAVVEQQLDHYAESIDLLDEVIETDPDREEAYYYRAKASTMAGHDIDRGLECARRYLEQCSRCDDSDRGHGWWRRATLLKHKGETDASIAAYREAPRFNPELEGVRKGLEELEQ